MWITKWITQRSKRFSAEEVSGLLDAQFQITKYEMIGLLRKDIELPGVEVMTNVHELYMKIHGINPIKYVERERKILQMVTE